MKSFVKQLNSVTAAKAGKPTYNLDTDEEFGVVGATYYAVAQAGYNYSGRQNIHYKNRKYNTLSAAEAALPATPTTPLIINILGTWSSAETNQISINNPTTTIDNYLLIRTIGEARHSGVWSTTAYRMSSSWETLRILVSYVKIDGFQLETSLASGNDFPCFNVDNGVGSEISNSIIRRVGSESFYGHGITIGSNYDGTFIARNCIIYDFNYTGDHGIITKDGGTHYLYNITIVNCETGIGGIYNIVAKNVLTQDCTDGFGSSLTLTGSDYNVSDIASDAPGSNSFQATVIFKDAANDDFHLDVSDSRLRGIGADLRSNFTKDIDGEIRDQTGAYDIGADEYHSFVDTVYNHYIYLFGGSDRIVTPDSTASSLTGDFDLRVKIAADDWTPSGARAILTKWEADNLIAFVDDRSFRFGLETTGKLRLWVSSTGANEESIDSTSATSFSDGEAGWVRVTFDASASTATFYKSTDYDPTSETGTWTSLGGGTGTFTSIYDSSSQVILGAWIYIAWTPTDVMEGKFYYAEMRNGIDGTIVSRFNASEIDSSETYLSNINGQEKWTNNGGFYSPGFYASHFDGSTTVVQRLAAPNVSNSKVGSISLWMNFTGNDATQTWVYYSNAGRVYILKQVDNTLRIHFANTSGETLARLDQDSAKVGVLTSTSGWTWVGVSVDNNSGGNAARLYMANASTSWVVTEALESAGMTYVQNDELIDWERLYPAFGGLYNAPSFIGDLSEVWFDATRYIDWSNPAEQAKFISNGRPVNLLGTYSPYIWLTNPVSSFSTNAGSGGDFTDSIGTLTDANSP